MAIAMFCPKFNFGQTAPDLGKASSFGVYTAAGAISNTNATVIKGDLGNDAGAITGFAPGVYSGNLHAADAVAAQADLDVHAAFAYLGGLSCGTSVATFTPGQVLLPGVYCIGAAASLTEELVLDAANDPKALFFINIGGVLNTAAGFKVTLKNGASASNVYWRVLGAVNMGPTPSFQVPL